MATNKVFSPVEIDVQLKDEGWDVLDTNSVRFEYVLPDKTKADYVLCGRNGRVLAVIEGYSQSILGMVGQPTEALNRAETAFQSLLALAFSSDLAPVAPVEQAAVA